MFRCAPHPLCACAAEAERRAAPHTGEHITFSCADDGSCYVSDHSRNGTFLNGRPLSNGVPTLLAEGDIVSPVVSTRYQPSELPEEKRRLLLAVLVFSSGRAADQEHALRRTAPPPAAESPTSADASADSREAVRCLPSPQRASPLDAGTCRWWDCSGSSSRAPWR